MARIIDSWLQFLFRSSKKQEATVGKKIVGLAFGIFFFFLPSVLLWGFGSFVSPDLNLLPWVLEILIGVGVAAFGIFFLFWSVSSQWMYGRGTPIYFIPTQKLVIIGPYRLCRNPMQLGAVLYYLGILTLFSSLPIGILGAFFIFVLGSAYHRFVEEKELIVCFGDEYKEYKQRTPFLIPRIW